jgi:hypothetical protein
MASKAAGDRILAFDVFQGENFLRREEINAESVTIGKGPAAMLRLDDPGVADLHAVININDDGSVQLLDLGSQTGTAVNNERVSNVSLSNGDMIGIGGIRIVVGISAEAMEDRTDQVGTPIMASAGAAPAAASAAKPNGDVHLVSSGATVEDVMAFVMGSGSVSSGPVDPTRPLVLEVAEIWGDIVVDVKHFAMASKPVTIGASVGWRWRVLSRPVAWVPQGFAKVAWAFPPTMSEATEEWKDDYYVPPGIAPNDDFKLFEWDGNQYVCNVSDKWAGFVDIGEERHTFQDLIAAGKARSAGGGIFQIPMGRDTRVIADVGPVQFFGQTTSGGKRVVTKLTENVDYPFLAVMSFMIFIGLMSSILIATMPPPPENEVMEIPDRFVEMLLKEPEVQPDKLDSPDAEGAKAKKEEGKVGKKDAKMEKAKGNKVEMDKQQVDKEIAEDAGVLGALRDGSELDNVFGTSGLSADITSGIGGLIGARGVQFGSGGLGSRGTGLGGGGTADGLGGLGTKGRGSGASGYGSGGGHFGQKGEGAIGAIGGDPIILGALDKSLVDAVVRRNLNQIRYCYQRELTKSPALAGKIVVKFVIAKDGTVSSATTKSSSMGSPAVENCINQRFMRFQFPSPKGGGIVFVTYPFIFAPG